MRIIAGFLLAALPSLATMRERGFWTPSEATIRPPSRD